MVRLLGDLGRPTLGAHSADISVLDEVGQMRRLVTSRRSAPQIRIRFATQPAFDPEQMKRCQPRSSASPAVQPSP
jgi:hypothetical protein